MEKRDHVGFPWLKTPLALTALVVGVTSFVMLCSWWGIQTIHLKANGSAARDSSVSGQTISNLIEGAELRIRGGIGLSVMTDPTTGLIRIYSVNQNSPAARAGLQADDLIFQVDGQPVQGVPLADVIARVRGFNGMQVELTVQSPDSTNSRLVTIRRVSLKKLIHSRPLSPFE